MADTKNLLVGLGAAASATLILHLWSRRNPEPPLPPSPKSYPLLGNALSMPPSNQHLGFMDLGKELNTNIFSLSMLGMVIIVLNSVDDAINLLEKRSNIYSDRVIPPMLGDPTLMDFGRATSLLPYDERWRKHRRLIHPWLHREAATAFQDLQQHEARKLLQRLAGIAERLEDSETLYSELFFTLSNTIMRSVYGYKLESNEDPLLTDLQKAIEHGSQAGMPANFLVNVFPFLKHVPEWLPGAGWKKVVNEWRKQQLDAVDDSYNWTKSRITAGDHEVSQSIVASMINHGSKLGLSSEEIDDYVSNIAMTLFAGGTETSANILLVFALAMTLHPEVQAKAQEEIDTVIGRERLPTVEDRLQLPYVSRLINELKRWCPIFPTGLPHACVQGDTYRGYKIPKGAMVMANIWAMSRDERHYKDPESFDPDRFLDPSVPTCPVFGFGRRLCPGLHYAEASIFIAIASMLATFSFSMAKDESGKELPPKLDSENVLIYHPKPFKLHLQLRSTHHAELVKAGVE